MPKLIPRGSNWPKIEKIRFLKKGHTPDFVEGAKMIPDTWELVPYKSRGWFKILWIKVFWPGVVGGS